MLNLPIHLPILLCLALIACTSNPSTRSNGGSAKYRQAGKVKQTGKVTHRTVSPSQSPTPVLKVARPVILATATPGVENRPENVQAVVKAAGDILRLLSKEQAQNAASELKPGASVSDDPQQEITEMLLDTTTMEQALQILKTLQHAKQE
jgi:hypothetical protein